MDRIHERIVSAADQVGSPPLDAAASFRIARYLELLDLWNRRFHLTGDRDVDTLVERHVADSLAIAGEVPEGGHLIDVGSGAGFPGVVVACARPDIRVTPIEARRRPVSFLSEVARSVPLPGLRPILGRAEDAGRHGLEGTGDVVVSRAIRADVFLQLARALVAPGGRIIVMSTPHQSVEAIASRGRELGFDVLSTKPYSLPGGELRLIVRLGAL